MKVARGPAIWARRALLAIFLIGAAVIPGRATSQQAPHCSGPRCITAGSVLWTRALPGSWVAQSGVSGTVTDQAAAYAADGGGVAAVGSGTLVTGYQASSGRWLWHVRLVGIPAGSTIVSVRAFTGVVAVGVEPPAGQSGAARDEVILSAATGRQIRIYPAASYGGAVQADAASTVIVGDTAVLEYSNVTGRVLWRRVIGSGEQTWRVADQYIYVTEPGGPTGGGVAALRRISLITGAERIIRLRPAAAGSLSNVLSVAQPGGQPPTDVLLFSGAGGVAAYRLNGSPRWHKVSAAPELADAGQGVVYVAAGSWLAGLDAASGMVISRAAISVSASLYTVSDGVALGLDQNALGEAWGYSLTAGRVAWTSPGLPWPHFFADMSGLGGSARAASDVALLAVCARVGTAPNAATAAPCARPELAAVLIRSR